MSHGPHAVAYMNSVSLIAHSDWSTLPTKRWVAVAQRNRGSFLADAPERVGDVRTFLPKLRRRARGGTVLAGFDFPIGVPIAYAKQARIRSFKTLFPLLGTSQWSQFYEPARSQAEISVARPFYPNCPGGTAQAHLVNGLGMTSRYELLRLCEQQTADRGPACSLFWTLGAKQVGRAAISGWRDLIGPAIKARSPTIGLWPFDGRLNELLAIKQCVIVETYPAEACAHVGLSRPGTGWSKRNRADRQLQGKKLQLWAEGHKVRFSESLDECISNGFGLGEDGEDQFDAVVGMLSMLAVVLGYRKNGAPDTGRVRNIEGWIFGQAG